MNNKLKFLEEHCEFNTTYDTYVLLAVSRKKDTESLTNSKEIVFREVLRRKKDIGRKLRRLRLNCKSYRDDDGKKYPFYIYITCNARNGKKACMMVMNKLMDCFYEESLGHDRSRIMKRVDREFISALMKPKSRGSTKYFMIDVDTTNKTFLNRVIDSIETEEDTYVEVIKSRNGFHIKSNPFNIKEFNDKFSAKELNKLVSVERDRLLFVDYIKNE